MIGGSISFTEARHLSILVMQTSSDIRVWIVLPAIIIATSLHSSVPDMHVWSAGDDSQPKTAIDFEEFVRLYVNHRPVLGISQDKILDAFRSLGCEPTSGIMSRDTLVEALLTRGEKFSEEELGTALEQLIGAHSLLDDVSNKNISASEFAEEVLGFEAQ